jgi:hypothetical protein
VLDRNYWIIVSVHIALCVPERSWSKLIIIPDRLRVGWRFGTKCESFLAGAARRQAEGKIITKVKVLKVVILPIAFRDASRRRLSPPPR